MSLTHLVGLLGRTRSLGLFGRLVRGLVRSLMLALCGASLAHASCLDTPLHGVNLAGAEFATRNLPGVLGTDYAYPSRNDLVYFQRAGMNTIRLPFRWERLQRRLQGPLDAAELAQIAQVVDWARALHLCVLLDMHNYATYQGQKIGSDSVPAQAFEDVWLRVLAAFPDSTAVAFGLMNEPQGMAPAAWTDLAQSTVLALRRAGSTHWLMVGSGRWSGAHEWHRRFDGASAADAFARFTDPLHRYAIEVHQYVDPNYSGTTVACVDPARLQATMQALAHWSRLHQVRFFMGEFGTPATPNCLLALHALLAPMQDHTVWLGWTYWAAGTRWGNYPLNIHPRAQQPPAAQLSVLRGYLP